VDAKQEFEAAQKILQSMKIQLMNVEISENMPKAAQGIQPNDR